MNRSATLRGAARAVPAALLLVVAGCGTSEQSSGDDDPTAPGDPAAFPVTVETGFGSVEIEEPPERVVTVGFSDQDFALALGVEPVGVREFLGYDATDRPWAPEGVRGKDIPTVGAEELDVEAVAELEPDLILGLNSYIDKRTYALLDKIAPTVAAPENDAPKWEEQTTTTGTALGLEQKATSVVRETKAAFEEAVEAHPQFSGTSAAFAFGGAYSLGRDDYRSGWLTDLGFELPARNSELSEEKLAPLDREVLITEGVDDELRDSAVFRSLDAVEQNRTVDFGGFDNDFGGALGFNSPLSLPYVLKVAVPRLDAATDADPSTKPEPYPEG